MLLGRLDFNKETAHSWQAYPGNRLNKQFRNDYEEKAVQSVLDKLEDERGCSRAIVEDVDRIMDQLPIAKNWRNCHGPRGHRRPSNSEESGLWQPHRTKNEMTNQSVGDYHILMVPFTRKEEFSVRRMARDA